MLASTPRILQPACWWGSTAVGDIGIIVIAIATFVFLSLIRGGCARERERERDLD